MVNLGRAHVKSPLIRGKIFIVVLASNACPIRRREPITHLAMSPYPIFHAEASISDYVHRLYDRRWYNVFLPCEHILLGIVNFLHNVLEVDTMTITVFLNTGTFPG